MLCPFLFALDDAGLNSKIAQEGMLLRCLTISLTNINFHYITGKKKPKQIELELFGCLQVVKYNLYYCN